MITLEYKDYAKDTKLNAQRIMNSKEGSNLSEKQIAITYLAAAYATRNLQLISSAIKDTSEQLRNEEVYTIKTVATIMASNNIYYRYIHNIKNAEISKLPAGLRMQGLRSDILSHQDVELAGLAISAINNCGLCMSSHTESLIKLGINPGSIQHSIQIAAVVGASAQMLIMESIPA